MIRFVGTLLITNIFLFIFCVLGGTRTRDPLINILHLLLHKPSSTLFGQMLQSGLFLYHINNDLGTSCIVSTPFMKLFVSIQRALTKRNISISEASVCQGSSTLKLSFKALLLLCKSSALPTELRAHLNFVIY